VVDDRETSPVEDREPELWPGFNAGMPAPPPRSVSSPEEGERPSDRRARPSRALALLVALLLLAGGVGLWRGATGDRGRVTLDQRPVATDVSNAVVTIETYQRVLGSDQLGGDRISVVPLGAATGMILTSSGEVLTNNHVVREATSIQVSVPGRSGTYTATVLGVDPSDDVALLQLQDASALPTVTLGDPTTLSVGDQVVAIGNALGQGSATATNGTVSGLHRTITAGDPGGPSQRLSDMIQTDATIQPGDSGGPLVNADGEVVGMITAGSLDGVHDASSNVGFAIPSDDALRIVEQIRAGDESSGVLMGKRGFLGIGVGDLDAATAAALGSTVSTGVVVTQVWPHSPAASIGITKSSIITAIDGQTVSSKDALGAAIHAHTPGEQIRVTWVDGDGTHTATAGLITGPAV
jgi:S1-C subfamily serine protease